MSRTTLAVLFAAALATPLGAAAPASAAQAAPDRAGSDVLAYSNAQGVVNLLTIGDKQAKLPGAPASFRGFARRSMRATWQEELAGVKACKGVPTFDVDRISADGFAFGNVSERPKPGCQDGGGYVAFWAVRHGDWRQVIGTQDVPDCARLEQLDFPSSVADTQCYDGSEVVQYVHE